MSTAFTPGPWTFDGPPHSVIVWGPEPDTRVCFMTSDGPAEANARLISAAPEMFEALLLVLAGYTKLGPFDEPLGASEQTAAVNAARAAIVKARGAA